MVTRADKLTSTDRKTQVYSDFLTDLNTHPVSGDTVRYVNEQAVIRAIKNLVMTKKGERLYQPAIGCDIHRLLFEPMGQDTAQTIAGIIESAIDKYEPRARVLNVDVAADYDNQKYVVTVKFLIVNKQDPITFNVTLNRVR